MRKNILWALLMIMFLGITATKSIYAQEGAGVTINDTNFPNQFLRETVQEKIDINNDGILQDEEINAVTTFALSLEEWYESKNNGKDPNLKENYYILDCKGLEYFKNLKELYLEVCRYEYDLNKRGYLNFDKIYQLKKLKKLTVIGDKLVKNWQFAKLPNLTKLNLESIICVEKMTFGEKLQKLTIVGMRGKAKLNLSKAKKLKKFSATDFYLKEVKFGKNENLKSIYIGIAATKGNENKKMKEIDVSGVKNLKRLTLSRLIKLKKVKLGKNKKLSSVFICDTPKLKTIDFKGCRISKLINLDKGVKIKNLWKGFKGKLQYL